MKEFILQKQLEYCSEFFSEKEILQIVENFLLYQHKTSNLLFSELTILHHFIFNGSRKDIYSLAAGIEMIILTADIYDDLEDQDNDDAPWRKENQAVVLNICSGLLVMSLKMIGDHSKEVLQMVHELLPKSIQGQHKDLTNHIQDEATYMEMIRNKSGSLTALACLAGAIYAKCNHLNIVRSYGEAIGMIAQMNNDIQGIQALETRSDLAQKKRSLPALYMLNSSQTNYISQYYSGELTYEHLLQAKDSVLEELEHYGAIMYTKVRIQLLYEEAAKKIDSLAIHPKAKIILKKLVGGHIDASNYSVSFTASRFDGKSKGRQS
ncbi:competence protein ComQ [Gracilibacillus halotolerans]|uniref:Competence protein ComQ n=1 Tax=Gracilibacillus halotolerans TaxID=74386 RepID=A0A841RL08_9BACI|nr:polyprenyl synthetase family protein [Gracilibacillus halotolerans]MBB6512557.1 competence protein ComQ [Gracilibacillus halotolerans]